MGDPLCCSPHEDKTYTKRLILGEGWRTILMTTIDASDWRRRFGANPDRPRCPSLSRRETIACDRCVYKIPSPNRPPIRGTLQCAASAGSQRGIRTTRLVRQCRLTFPGFTDLLVAPRRIWLHRRVECIEVGSASAERQGPALDNCGAHHRKHGRAQGESTCSVSSPSFSR